MAAAYDDTVFDFDLNFLQTSRNASVPNAVDKHRRTILRVKKKTIATDSLIRKYYGQKEILEENEKSLLNSKEECKKICIEYKSALEKCAQLEKDAVVLQNLNIELERKCSIIENQYEAMQCHANQLQVLVKNQEATIDGMKLQKNMQEPIKNSKDNKKEVLALEKENELLLQHIGMLCDVVFGKKKLSKRNSSILQKYAKSSHLKRSSLIPEESPEDDNDSYFEESVLSPMFNEDDSLDHTIIQNKETTSLISKDVPRKHGSSDDIDRESVSSNGVTSEDTGRGSSLALSYSDKFFHSPNYVNDDSPLSIDVVSHKEKPVQVDSCTSPIMVAKVVNIATSPVIFDEQINTDSLKKTPRNRKSRSPLKSYNVSPKVLKEMKDVATSPMHTKGSPEKETNKRLSCDEMECLEQNNSINLVNEDSSDCEIEMILNKMQLCQGFVTPIPPTPARARNEAASSNTKTALPDHVQFTCPEAAKLREENKVLHSNIADIAKEILNIKSLLKNQLLGDVVKQNSHENSVIVQKIVNDGNNDVAKTVKNSIYMKDAVNDNNIEMPIDSLITCADLNIEERQEIEVPDYGDDLSNPEYADDIISTDIIELNYGNGNDVTQPTDTTILDRLQFEEETQDIMIHRNPNEQAKDLKDGEAETQIIHEVMPRRPHRKLTRLQKFKEKIRPKHKIIRARTPTISKSRLRRRQWLLRSNPILTKKKPEINKIRPIGDSSTLNDKNTYEKALKVMAEINSTKKDIKTRLRKRQGVKRLIKRDLHKQNDDNIVKDDVNIESTVEEVPLSSTPSDINTKELDIDKCKDNKKEPTIQTDEVVNDTSVVCNTDTMAVPVPVKRNLKRPSVEQLITVPPKRVLRSATRKLSLDTPKISEEHVTIETEPVNSSKCDEITSDVNQNCDNNSNLLNIKNNEGRSNASYNDLDMFSDKANGETRSKDHVANNQQEGLLCRMLEKYCVKNVKYTAKVSDSTITSMHKNIEDNIAQILDLTPSEAKSRMDDFAEEIRHWNMKHFLSGLMKYLQSPERKLELFKKVNSPPAPPMSKQEQILLYVVTQLNKDQNLDIVNKVLNCMDYTLFKLNSTPEFDAIESMSHFYAILCRYFNAKSRLRLFILDAMYCIQFKAVPLIKQCLDVWMHTLPLAHMGIAKTPLVTSLVYLLHFYRCQDKFNRVRDIRILLNKKYLFKITDWNDNQILDMFRKSIKALKDIPIERKMLRMALIILAKRQGPRWCQNNVIKNLLQPLIEDHGISDVAKHFCISILGPLMKAYPIDMKVNCEVAMNKLFDMLEQNLSPQLEEAVYTSLIYMSKHNQQRVTKALVEWKPKAISADLESLLRDYVREKPLRVWKSVLSRI